MDHTLRTKKDNLKIRKVQNKPSDLQPVLAHVWDLEVPLRNAIGKLPEIYSPKT